MDNKLRLEPEEPKLRTIKQTQTIHATTCPTCGKELTHPTETVLRTNYQIHQTYCKGKQR